LHESGFELKDIGTQIRDAINDFKSSPEHRTCSNCGTVMNL
jgi:3-hydroxyanthranilate 3,4-dioxygenase